MMTQLQPVSLLLCCLLPFSLAGCWPQEATDAAAAASGASATAGGQQDPAPSAPRPQDPAADAAAMAAARKMVAEMQEKFAAAHITVDTDARTVTVPAVMNEPRDPVEYLLIHRKGKMHEAVFYTHSQPSLINAALLLLGFERGKNATYREKDPAPTLDEIEAGADPIVVTPPEGREFWMTVRFDDGSGKKVEYCVEDLLYDLRGDGPVGEVTWIYLGGRMASLYKGEPEVFVADFEGNLVSVCYLAPDNHLSTMKHERARDDQNWWLTDKCPKPNTEVEFVFHAIEPPVATERKKRLRAAGGDAPKEAPKSAVPEGRNGGR